MHPLSLPGLNRTIAYLAETGESFEPAPTMSAPPTVWEHHQTQQQQSVARLTVNGEPAWYVPVLSPSEQVAAPADVPNDSCPLPCAFLSLSVSLYCIVLCCVVFSSVLLFSILLLRSVQCISLTENYSARVLQ